MKNKKLQIFGWVFIMLCMIIGGLALGNVITLILYKWNKKRRAETLKFHLKFFFCQYKILVSLP